MDMGVKDAWHDEFSAQVCDLALILRKTGLVAHINEFAFLHRKSGCQRVVLVSCEDFCIFNNLVCFHFVSFRSSSRIIFKSISHVTYLYFYSLL